MNPRSTEQEVRDCSYCEDGTLSEEPLDGHDWVYECSNLGDCPAGFVFSMPCGVPTDG